MKLLVFFAALFATTYGFRFELGPLLGQLKDDSKFFLQNFSLSSSDLEDTTYLPERVESYELSNIKIEELEAKSAVFIMEGQKLRLEIRDLKLAISAQASFVARLFCFGKFCLRTEMNEKLKVSNRVVRADLVGRLDEETDRLVLESCNVDIGEFEVSVGDMTEYFPQTVAKLVKTFFEKQEKALDVCQLIKMGLGSVGAFNSPIKQVIATISGTITE